MNTNTNQSNKDDIQNHLHKLKEDFEKFWSTLDESKIEDSITLDYLKLLAEKCWLNGRLSIYEWKIKQFLMIQKQKCYKKWSTDKTSKSKLNKFQNQVDFKIQIDNLHFKKLKHSFKDKDKKIQFIFPKRAEYF